MKLTDKQKNDMIETLIENMEFWDKEDLLEYAQNKALEDLLNMDDEQLKMIYEQYIKSQLIH